MIQERASLYITFLTRIGEVIEKCLGERERSTSGSLCEWFSESGGIISKRHNVRLLELRALRQQIPEPQDITLAPC